MTKYLIEKTAVLQLLEARRDLLPNEPREWNLLQSLIKDIEGLSALSAIGQALEPFRAAAIEHEQLETRSPFLARERLSMWGTLGIEEEDLRRAARTNPTLAA